MSSDEVVREKFSAPSSDSIQPFSSSPVVSAPVGPDVTSLTVKSKSPPALSVTGVPEHDSPGELPSERDEGEIIVFESSLTLAAADHEGTEWVDPTSDPPWEGNVLVADTSFGEQASGSDSDTEGNIAAADTPFEEQAFASDPPWEGNILVADTSFGEQEGSGDSDPEDVRAFMDGVATAFANTVAQECGLETLRVHNVDGLDLTQDMERLPSPQVSDLTLRQADAIHEEEQSYLVAQANKKRKQEEDVYVNEYG